RSLPLQHIILVADDSHGLGITGPQGGGAYKTLRELRPKDLVVCGSLGKGFGIQAGVVFGSRSLINALAETDMVIASSPAAPATLATFLQAQQLYAEKRRALLHHITTFTAAIHPLSRFRYIENYPAFSYADETLSAHLLRHNIITTHFKYPNENAGTVSRIVLSAHHTGADMLQLITAVNSHPTKPLH
ncbi:MAG: aminotransferase class I/II-fold pyridoxal phosphate-dependent enzyme, partial [Sinomicrobium sp.]|nr:aminotransferase class I/II-fold pyridoxal phosphate-dependent enzyme [Sinomicrobium sp.]